MVEKRGDGVVGGVQGLALYRAQITPQQDKLVS